METKPEYKPGLGSLFAGLTRGENYKPAPTWEHYCRKCGGLVCFRLIEGTRLYVDGCGHRVTR